MNDFNKHDTCNLGKLVKKNPRSLLENICAISPVRKKLVFLNESFRILFESRTILNKVNSFHSK